MRKNDQNKLQKQYLGMAISTARSRLFKKIIYQLTLDCNKNICYRCGKTINSVDDFSVDHKKDWRYKEEAKDLFFDLGNIAFSHQSCNSSFSGAKRTKKGISGYKGVIYVKKRNKYRVHVYWRKKVHFIGYFDNAAKAADAYKKAAFEIQGDKAVLE